MERGSWACSLEVASSSLDGRPDPAQSASNTETLTHCAANCSAIHLQACQATGRWQLALEIFLGMQVGIMCFQSVRFQSMHFQSMRLQSFQSGKLLQQK